MRMIIALFLMGLHGAAHASPEAPVCALCAGAPGTELDPSAWAGIWDGKPYQCQAADDYLALLAEKSKPCDPFKTWVERCCKAVPTSAPTPAPTPPPTSTSPCDVCPDSTVLRHHYAGKDEKGLYTCARAVNSLQSLLSRGRSGVTCATARRDWRRWCCAATQPKCNICPRGMQDVKKWASAGRWTGAGGRLSGSWVTCHRASLLMRQESSAPQCNKQRIRLQDTCCYSRR